MKPVIPCVYVTRRQADGLNVYVFGSVLDVDECGSELGICPTNTYCFNTDGSFACRGQWLTIGVKDPIAFFWK